METETTVLEKPTEMMIGKLKVVGYIVAIETSKIGRNPNQPRTEREESDIPTLAKSMKARGQEQVATVAKWSFPGQPELEYIMVGGETRLLAAIEAEIPTLECRVIEVKDEADLHEKSIVDNHVRVPLGPLDMVMGIITMKKNGRTAVYIADSLGMTPTTVYGYLKIGETLKSETIARLSIKLEPENRLRLQVAKLLTDYADDQEMLVPKVLGKSVKEAQLIIGLATSQRRGKGPRPSDLSVIVSTFGKRTSNDAAVLSARIAENPNVTASAIKNMDPVTRLTTLVNIRRARGDLNALEKKLETGSGTENAAVLAQLEREQLADAAKKNGNGAHAGDHIAEIPNGELPRSVLSGPPANKDAGQFPKTWDGLLAFVNATEAGARQFAEATPAELDAMFGDRSEVDLEAIMSRIALAKRHTDRVEGIVGLRKRRLTGSANGTKN